METLHKIQKRIKGVLTRNNTNPFNPTIINVHLRGSNKHWKPSDNHLKLLNEPGTPFRWTAWRGVVPGERFSYIFGFQPANSQSWLCVTKATETTLELKPYAEAPTPSNVSMFEDSIFMYHDLGYLSPPNSQSEYIGPIIDDPSVRHQELGLRGSPYTWIFGRAQ